VRRGAYEVKSHRGVLSPGRAVRSFLQIPGANVTVWLLGWGVTTLDADTVYRPLFRSGSVLANYSNAEVDRLVDEARTTMDGKKRLGLYHRIGRILIEDTPAVPLNQQVDLYGVAKRLVWKARSDEAIRVYDMALADGK